MDNLSTVDKLRSWSQCVLCEEVPLYPNILTSQAFSWHSFSLHSTVTRFVIFPSTEHVPGPGFFPLPENDTVVQAARQLSGLATRKNLRSSLSCDHNLSGLARRQTPRPQTGTYKSDCTQKSLGVNVTGWCWFWKLVKSH